MVPVLNSGIPRNWINNVIQCNHFVSIIYHFEYILDSNNLMDKKQQCEKIGLQVYYKYFFHNKHEYYSQQVVQLGGSNIAVNKSVTKFFF